VLDGHERAAIEAAVAQLASDYAAPERGLRLVQVAGGWQLATKPELAEVVRRLFTGKRRVRLTKAALETLAIIAYKQPTTRPEVDAIRGVASGGVLETLLERSLIRIAGRSESVGRPLLYATTPEFLQYLGLYRLADLPSLEELEQMLAEREAAARLAEDEEMRELAEAAQAGPPPGAGVEMDAAPAAPLVPPAARLEERLRERDLPTLEELDEELRERGERVAALAARVASERARHAAEFGPPEPEAASPRPGAEMPEPGAGAPPEAARTVHPGGPDPDSPAGACG
jgi:segregation and condensation protein B